MAIKILLADDSLTIQKVVELTFSDAQTRLVAVGSGDRAVEALDDFQPDLVLADVVMPGLSGYDVCEAVKQRPGGAFIPVVLLTGTFEPFDRARAERVGSDAIVTKPFDSHALQGLVHELVGKARLAREAAAAEAAAAPAAAPEPPPTMILSAEELAGEFPAPAPIPVPVDTASTLVLSPLDLAEPAPPPSAEAATAVPEGESIYSTMAMPVLSGDELGAPLEETPPPPPPPAFYEPEPAFVEEPPPPPSYFEPETVFVAPPPPPPPAFYEPEAGPDTAPLPLVETPVHLASEVETGPVAGEMEVELEEAPYEPAASPAAVVEETAEPFPEMDEPPPMEAEAAPWDEVPVAEIPPPPPELVGAPAEEDHAEPITRDLDADLAAFEASGLVRRRPEIWERHAALIGEEIPDDIDVHTPSGSPSPEPEPSSASSELEEIAAAARLEDLSKLIPVSASTPAEEAPDLAVEPAPSSAALSDGDVDRIARRVVELLSDRIVRDIAWEVVPEYAERLVRERIAEVERAG